MNNKQPKSKLTPAAVKAMASDFWRDMPVRRHESGQWKVITLFHGLPMDAPGKKADAYYESMVGDIQSADRVFFQHTAHLPVGDAHEVYRLRNATLRDAVHCGVSAVVVVQDGDTAILKILQTAKDKGYRIEMQSYLSHMGMDAPQAEYNWKSHIGALRILPQLQALCDQWQLNWQRQAYAVTETVMARYMGSDDSSVSSIHNKLALLYPDMTQKAEISYDAILYARRGEGVNSLQTLLALHLGNDLKAPDIEPDAPAAPEIVTPSPDLRSGDFFRLLRRIDTDLKRIESDDARAFAGLHHAQRTSYQVGLSALRDMIATHVGDKMALDLTPLERQEMGFKPLRSEQLGLNKI